VANAAARATRFYPSKKVSKTRLVPASTGFIPSSERGQPISPRKKRLLESAAIPRAAVEDEPVDEKPKKKRKKKKRPAFRRRSKHRKPGDAHTIPSFCESNAISESKYFSLKRQGKAPREIDLDGRIIITPEAEVDWRREREAETMAKRQAAEPFQAAPVGASATT
jgi:hypothetical protein